MHPFMDIINLAAFFGFPLVYAETNSWSAVICHAVSFFFCLVSIKVDWNLTFKPSYLIKHSHQVGLNFACQDMKGKN